MSLKFIEGNLLESHANFICHQVNCCGVMGSGVAWQIRNKWPIVYEEYKNKYNSTDDKKKLLGSVQQIFLKEESKKYNKSIYVMNMFTQYNYGKKGRYTNYEAFYESLVTIRAKARLFHLFEDIPMSTLSPQPTIAFPYKIGCDRGGANWNIINTMIYETLGMDFNVEIYKLKEQ